MQKLEELIKLAQGKGKKIVVAGANDEHVLEAVKEGVINNIVEPILVGSKKEIEVKANNISFDISKFKIIEAQDEKEIAKKSVIEVSEGRADILMKGLINTGTILKLVLNKEYKLNMGNVLSHVAIMEIPNREKLISVTDAALNPNPDIKQKGGIIKNAVGVARSIGIETPKVALIAANEKVSPKMQATVDAAIISKMVERGSIQNCIVDGPLALDISISKEALETKKIESPVNGDADILVVPAIDAGNVLYKSLIYFAQAQTAGIICGAKNPVVVTSRADSAKSKLYSIALACSYDM